MATKRSAAATQAASTETLPLEEYQKICDSFDEGVYQAISLEKCVGGRRVLGGPAPENVRFQARRVLELVGKE